MTTTTDKTYRGIFRKADGSYLAMNFFAGDRGLALSHALCLATDTHTTKEHGPLAVARVTRYEHDGEAGVFYRVLWVGELRGFYGAPEAK